MDIWCPPTGPLPQAPHSIILGLCSYVYFRPPGCDSGSASLKDVSHIIIITLSLLLLRRRCQDLGTMGYLSCNCQEPGARNQEPEARNKESVPWFQRRMTATLNQIVAKPHKAPKSHKRLITRRGHRRIRARKSRKGSERSTASISSFQVNP